MKVAIYICQHIYGDIVVSDIRVLESYQMESPNLTLEMAHEIATERAETDYFGSDVFVTVRPA